MDYKIEKDINLDEETIDLTELFRSILKHRLN